MKHLTTEEAFRHREVLERHFLAGGAFAFLRRADSSGPLHLCFWRERLVKQLSNLSGTCLGAALLAACGGSAGVGSGLPSSISPPIASTARAPYAEALKPPAATKSARIYVVQQNNSTMNVYDEATGKRLLRIVQAMDVPQFVAVNSNGKILVSQNGSDSMTSYTATGVKTSPTITQGVGGYGLSCPRGVATDPQNNIYLASACDGYLYIYNSAGAQIGAINVSRYSGPMGIAIDSTGLIWVALTSSGVVSTYHADGTPGSVCICSGLDKPVGLAIDKHDKVYVVNQGANELLTFTTNGTPTSPTIRGLKTPVGVAVDNRNGSIYITNSGNGTLYSYSAAGARINPRLKGLNGPVGVAVH